MKKFLLKSLLGLIIFPTIFSLVGYSQSPSEKEQALLDALNTARTNPTFYLPLLEKYKGLFEGKRVNGIQTFDGTAAVDEAIKFLKSASKLEPFKLSIGLSKSAQLQVNDLKENTVLGLVGKDGSTVPQRAAKFGKGGKLYAANISLYHSEAQEIVMHLIIDDGVKGRGNRKNIFNQTLQYLGIACGNGKNDEPISLMVFADKFVETTK